MSNLDVTSFGLGIISAIGLQILQFVVREKLTWHFKIKRGKGPLGEELERFRILLMACVTNSTVTFTATQMWGLIYAKDELILSIPQYAEIWRQLNGIFPALMVEDLEEAEKGILLKRLDDLGQTLNPLSTG